jgi:hypothetical protein
MSNKWIWVAMIAVAIIAVLGWFYPHSVTQYVSQALGGVTNYDELDATATITGGSNGSRIDLVKVGTCSLVSNAYTVTASSSAVMSCAITGVTSGDTVLAWFATSTFNGAGGPGWLINGVIASTTADGFAEVRVSNMTGGNAVVPANIASSTSYMAFSTRSTVPGL